MFISRTSRISMAASAILWAILCNQIVFAEQPKKAEEKKAGAKEDLFNDASSEQTEPLTIDYALKCWINPPNLNDEHWAVLTLFGDTHWFPRKVLPQQVQKLLLARRLNYRYWKSRDSALRNLASWLENDSEIPALLALLRDGLNDPHPKVRAEGAELLVNAYFVVTSGAFDPKEKAAKARFEKRRDDWAEAIIDLAMNKGLTDDDYDVRNNAWIMLETYLNENTEHEKDPTFTSLRALDRLLARKILRPDDQQQAEKLRAKWSKAIQGDK